MRFEITSGIEKVPQKVVIYGPEGVGKSTLAAQFPSPLFIDTEGGSGHMDVRRLPKPDNWAMLLEEVAYVRDYPEECGGTLVIDTADWAQKMASDAVCVERDLKSIEDMGYGKGYTCVCEKFSALLKLLTEVNKAGLNVVVNAHAVISKFEQPDEMGAYDRWSLKLQDGKKASISAMVKEWADAVLFANYKTVVIAVDKDGNKHKAQGGQNRMLWCNHSATIDAKNRWGLPDVVPMDWAQLAPHIPVPSIKVPDTKPTSQAVEEAKIMVDPFTDSAVPATATLRALMLTWNVTDSALTSAIVKKGYMPEGTPIEEYPEDFVQWLTNDTIWKQVVDYIQQGN